MAAHFGQIADQAERAADAIERLTAAVEALNGAEAVVKVRFEAEDLTDAHPLIASAVAADRTSREG